MGVIDGLTEAQRRQAANLRKRLWSVLQGSDPAPAADAVVTVLAHLIVKTALDPQATGRALAGNLLCLTEPDDGEPGSAVH